MRTIALQSSCRTATRRGRESRGRGRGLARNDRRLFVGLVDLGHHGVELLEFTRGDAGGGVCRSGAAYSEGDSTGMDVAEPAYPSACGVRECSRRRDMVSGSLADSTSGQTACLNVNRIEVMRGRRRDRPTTRLPRSTTRSQRRIMGPEAPRPARCARHGQYRPAEG